MCKAIKHELHASVPKSITLDETKKNAILQEARKRLETKESSRKSNVKPVIAIVAVISLSGIIAVPYVQEELQQNATQEEIISKAIQQVTINGVDYSALIDAVYVDGLSEMIYTDGRGIFAYSLSSHITQTIVDPRDDAQITGVSLAANEDWIAWDDVEKSSYFVNRANGQIKEIGDTFGGDLQFVGNRILYMSSPGWKRSASYELVELNTYEKLRIHELSGEGSYSHPGINDKTLAITERLSEEVGGGTSFTIYDIEKNLQVGTYTLPYERAENVTITSNKVYAQLSNEDGSSIILGYIDLEDGQFHVVEAPVFDAYAVHENYLALSVPVKDSNTVKLYAIENDKTKLLPYLDHIKERLVKPRFTTGGSLVLNGEGADRTMYIVDVNMLK